MISSHVELAQPDLMCAGAQSFRRDRADQRRTGPEVMTAAIKSALPYELGRAVGAPKWQLK
jgi:hypothetical protein